jgi:RsmE family RNA methyltransferase
VRGSVGEHSGRKARLERGRERFSAFSQAVNMVNLFLIEEADVVDGHVVIREQAKVEHLQKVLKVEAGSTIKMGMLGGMLYTGHIVERATNPATRQAEYRVRLEAVPGSEWHAEAGSAGVCLVLGTPRPSMVKSVSTVAATMGVDTLAFVRSERVDKSYFQSKALGAGEMRKNMLHGAEQGVLRRLPLVEVFGELSLEAFLRDAWPALESRLRAAHPGRAVVRLLAEPRVPTNLLRATCEQLARLNHEAPFFAIAIGPEGGWIPSEVELFKAAGFAPFHCGEHILRTETAVVALLAQAALVRDALRQRDQISPSLVPEKRARFESP